MIGNKNEETRVAAGVHNYFQQLFDNSEKKGAANFGYSKEYQWWMQSRSIKKAEEKSN